MRTAQEVAKMRKTLVVESQDLNLTLRTLTRAYSCILSFVFHMNGMACAGVCVCARAQIKIIAK